MVSLLIHVIVAYSFVSKRRAVSYNALQISCLVFLWFEAADTVSGGLSHIVY